MIFPGDIVAAVSRATRVSMAEIYGRKRSQQISDARHIAMYLIRENTDLSYPQIGRIMGQRDHSTIIHGHRKIRREMARRPDYAATVNAIWNVVWDGRACAA